LLQRSICCSGISLIEESATKIIDWQRAAKIRTRLFL